MKKTWILICLLTLAVCGSIRAAADRPIEKNNLPARAQQLLATSFQGMELSYAKEDPDWTDHTFEAVFVNGNKVEFDRNGNWKEIDCRYGVVPSALVPEPILRYVEKNHTGATVNAIERGRRGYEVKLSNGLELTFDKRFRVTDIDD